MRIATVDKILFPEFDLPKNLFRVYRTGFPFRENQVRLEDIDNRLVQQFMQKWNEWKQEEFILELQVPCWIEPDHGWAIVSPNRLIYFSLGISRTEFQRKPGLLKLIRKEEVISLPRGLSLRDTGEENYFHFYNDVLTKIFLLRKNNFDLSEVPIVVSKRLWDKPYFQYYLHHNPEFQVLRWIIQDHQYIHCQTAIFCKALTHRSDLWLELLGPISFSRTGNRKIFVTRRKPRLRYLENSDEIEGIASRYGLEIVDCDQLSVEKQIEIFASSVFIAGIHGAGLTNMVFRNGACQVVEIFPPPDLGYLPFHYIMLARMRNFQYQALVAESGRIKYSGGFYLDPEKWEKQLSRES